MLPAPTNRKIEWVKASQWPLSSTIAYNKRRSSTEAHVLVQEFADRLQEHLQTWGLHFFVTA